MNKNSKNQQETKQQNRVRRSRTREPSDTASRSSAK